MAKILVWFPHGVHPPRMGSQVRALELLRALGSTGHEIELATGWNPPSSGMGWPREALEHVRGLGVSKIHVHRSRIDDFMGLVARKTFANLREIPIGSWRFTPPLQVRWFADLVRRSRPDHLLMNYSVSDPLVEAAGFDRRKCLLETHDLVLLNKRMQRSIVGLLGDAPYHPSKADPRVLELDWFHRPEFDAADDQESRICARYGLCLSISSRESDRLRRGGARVVHLPMSMPTGPEGNTWDGGAILAAGPNAFNVQGYLWFVAKVAPLLRPRVADFRLDLTGSLSLNIEPTESVRTMGIVEDLPALYLGSKFAICPVFGGTGQQVKIVEAMAHGLPVVSLADSAAESPIRHMENGWICRDEQEFAQACERLWTDRELRERLGGAARETVRNELSSDLYAGAMRDALGAIVKVD